MLCGNCFLSPCSLYLSGGKNKRKSKMLIDVAFQSVQRYSGQKNQKAQSMSLIGGNYF